MAVVVIVVLGVIIAVMAVIIRRRVSSRASATNAKVRLNVMFHRVTHASDY